MNHIRATAIMVLACILPAADVALDLSKAANMDFRDEVAGDGRGGWSDQGPDNDLHGFDVARRDFDGVPFSIIDPARNGGKAVLTFDHAKARTGLTRAVIACPTPRPEGRFLYLLHTSCWNSEPAGSAIGTIEVAFADGTMLRREVKAREDIADWWGAGDRSNARVVVRRRSADAETGVFLSKFKLGDADREVAAVTLVGAGKAVWIVLGATLSPRDIDLARKDLVFAAGEEWKVPDMSTTAIRAGSALDLSGLADAPAGKYGRAIVAPDGSLAFAERPDTPLRLLGFTGGPAREDDGPTQEAALANRTVFAERLQRQGYDLWRAHMLDTYLMPWDAAAECAIDPGKLELVDKMIAELKARGIYTCISIAAYRNGEKTGSTVWARDRQRKTRMYLGEEAVRRNWQEMARILLTHVNPFTGVAWKDEPAIIGVEFWNEQEFGFYSLEKLPADAHAELDRQWRAWLLGRHGSREAVAKAWNRPDLAAADAFDRMSAPGPVVADFELFTRNLAREEFRWCEGIVRGLGYNGLVTQYNLGKSMRDSAVRWEFSPLVTMNTYHTHPTDFTNPGSTCPQTSAVGGMAGYWRAVDSTRIADRPLLVSEHNLAFWNRYQHEGGLLFSSYSALQGFAGMTVHVNPVDLNRNGPIDSFSVARSPVMRANDFLAAALFRRGDVARAKRRIEVRIPSASIVQQALNTEQTKLALLTGFTVAFQGIARPTGLPSPRPADLVLLPDSGAEIAAGAMATSIVDAKGTSFKLADCVARLKAEGILPRANLTDPEKGVFQAETGEITLRSRENMLKVVTKRSEGVTLEDGRGERLDRLEVRSSSVPAAIAVVSVDGRPLASSTRMVLVYATDTANTGMQLSGDRTVLRKLGTMPVLLQTGRLAASLRNANAAKLALYALRIDGERLERLPLIQAEGGVDISIDTARLANGPTVFFELVAE